MAMPSAARRVHEFVHALRRQAELRVLAAGADLLVVAVAVAEVDAQPQRATAEQLRPARSSSTLSTVTVTPRSNAARYSSIGGAKLG